MNLSASAFIRPLLRHVCQILGSTNPILRVPKLALILNDLCGASESPSLPCGTIMASIKATRSFADFACLTISYQASRVFHHTHHAAHSVERLAQIENPVHWYLSDSRLQCVQGRTICRRDERSYCICTNCERAESRSHRDS
jgi:hypothetical protein